MITKQDILKMVKRVSRRSQGKPDKRIIHPEREWVIGIGLFLLLVIAGGVYNAYTYNRITNLESEVEPAEQSSVRYRESQVNQALDTYRSRSKNYQTLQSDLPELVVIEEVVATTTASTTLEVVEE